MSSCCLHQEHKRFPIVQHLHSLCSELHLGTLLLLASVVSLQYLVGSYGYSCTISVCTRAISVLQIFPHIPCLCLTAAHPVTTPIQVKVGGQSLSLTVFLFHYQGFHQFSHRDITVTESNLFEEITTASGTIKLADSKSEIIQIAFQTAKI